MVTLTQNMVRCGAVMPSMHAHIHQLSWWRARLGALRQLGTSALRAQCCAALASARAPAAHLCAFCVPGSRGRSTRAGAACQGCACREWGAAAAPATHGFCLAGNMRAMRPLV